MKIATALFCATCSRAAVLVGAAPLVYCSARPGSRSRGSGISRLRASRCDVEKNLQRSLSPILLSVPPQGSSGWKAPPLGICAFEACHSCRGIYICIYIWLSHKEEINCILLKHFACLSSFAWKLSGAADLIKMRLCGHFVCKV